MKTKKPMHKACVSLFAMLAVFLMVSVAWATTYHVDPTYGNDNNDGLSPATPWKTIVPLASRNLAPGDRILIKREDVWRERIALYGLHMDLTYNGDTTRRKLAIAKARALNGRVSRNSFLWHKIEVKEGIRDWSIADSVVDDLLAAGIEPLFVIYGSPSWANGVSPSVQDYFLYVPTDNAAFLQWVEKYQDFVAEAVRRYQSKVKKWELWNEENEHFFWKPKPDIDKYALWYQKTYQTIKAIDPNADVALGGLAGLCCSGPEDYDGKTFLQELYNRRIYPDIIAIHPYSDHAPDVHVQWNNNFDDIQLIRDIMVSNGQGSKEVWVTEWGWPTAKISERDQAVYLVKSLEMIKTLYPFVTLATYFLDYDRPPEYFHGLYTRDFRLKEAGVLFKTFVEKIVPPSPPSNLKIQ